MGLWKKGSEPDLCFTGSENLPAYLIFEYYDAVCLSNKMVQMWLFNEGKHRIGENSTFQNSSQLFVGGLKTRI